MVTQLRRITKISLDIISLIVALLLAYLIRYDEMPSAKIVVYYYVIFLLIYIGVYFKLNIQNRSWRFTSVLEVGQVMILNLCSGIVLFIAFIVEKRPQLSVIPVTIVITIILQLLNRYLLRVLRYLKTKSTQTNGERTLIIGAGEAGEAILKERLKNSNFKYKIIGFIDEDPKKAKLLIHGCKVLGNKYKLKEIIENYGIETVIIAIPSATSKQIQGYRILLKSEKVKIKIVPPMEGYFDLDKAVGQIRDVKIEDLLGREEISINNKNLDNLIEGKTIFVTGGAGSIGSELSRQIAKHNPKRLVAIDVNENDLYFLELELKRKYIHLDFVSEICNVRELEKVDWLFDRYKPNLVFHAAAHKHVPLMEHNPEEAIKNNIFGTKNVADSAEKYGVERMVLISTDKAVNPTNIMGATKRGCELVIEDKAKKSKTTKFMAVRFGNVLGSNGSVIPIFKQLIAEGKNLTLTHADITRYFMTIPEAAQLVIEAGYLGEGGEVFILDMGEPIKIIDLARNLIELADADVGIDIVGLRPGEKLYEELLYDVNAAIKTENKKIFITKLKSENIDLESNLKELKSLIKSRDIDSLKEKMKEFIITYREPSHHKKVK